MKRLTKPIKRIMTLAGKDYVVTISPQQDMILFRQKRYGKKTEFGLKLEKVLMLAAWAAADARKKERAAARKERRRLKFS